MHRKLTITLDEQVYEGLHKVIGRRRMSAFIESLLRPHVIDTDLESVLKMGWINWGDGNPTPTSVPNGSE